MFGFGTNLNIVMRGFRHNGALPHVLGIGTNISSASRQVLDTYNAPHQVLGIGTNLIGDKGAVALASACPREGPLRTLWLGFNRIGPAGELPFELIIVVYCQEHRTNRGACEASPMIVRITFASRPPYQRPTKTDNLCW